MSSRARDLEFHTFTNPEMPQLDPHSAVIVPQRVWAAATGAREFGRRRPIKFAQNGLPGIRLIDALNNNVLGMRDAGTREYTTENSVRVAIRIQWPGYEGWHKHINVYSHGNNTEHITKGRLAHEVAREVQRCLSELSYNRSTEALPDWWVQNVPLERLMLLELHHVGQGSWQPVLARML